MPADCIGSKCHMVSFEIGPERAERFHIHGDLTSGGDPRVHDFPEEDSGYYHMPFFDTLRRFFTDMARQEMINYMNPVEPVCEGDCNCILSEDPKDITAVESRVPVETQWDFPNGSGSLTIYGSFLLTTIRTEGLCTVGEPVGKRAPLKTDKLYAMGYSKRAIEVVTGRKPDAMQQQKAPVK